MSRKFKAELEDSQKKFAVDATLKELESKVVIPAEAKEEMIAREEKYSFSQLDTWKTECKAAALDFALRENTKPGVVRIATIWGTTTKVKDDLWASH